MGVVLKYLNFVSNPDANIRIFYKCNLFSLNYFIKQQKTVCNKGNNYPLNIRIVRNFLVKKYFLIPAFVFLCTFSLSAQKQKIQNQPYGDQRLYHFGLMVGLNAQDLVISNSGFTEITEDGDKKTWFCAVPDYKPGLSVGLLADYYLNRFTSLRFAPALHFGDLGFKFREDNTGETFAATIRSNNIMFPLDIKLSSLRSNNYRPYFIVGGYGSFIVGRQLDEAILFKQTDYGFSFGFGCDFYLPIIKICPEIRFCFGLKDMIEKNRSDLRDQTMLKYTEAISKGASRMLVLTFNFE